MDAAGQCRCRLGACSFTSFSLAQQNFGDEGDDGTCRLVRVKFRKEVTHIFPGTSWLLGYETKDPAGTKAGIGPCKPCGWLVPGQGWAQHRDLLGGGSICVGPSVKREHESAARGTAPEWAAEAGRTPGRGSEEGSPAVLGVRAREGDAVHWVMAAKEEPVRGRG